MVRPSLKSTILLVERSSYSFLSSAKLRRMLPLKRIHHRAFSPGSLALGICSFDRCRCAPGGGIGTCRLKTLI
jgi:hypothetical protein